MFATVPVNTSKAPCGVGTDWQLLVTRIRGKVITGQEAVAGALTATPVHLLSPLAVRVEVIEHAATFSWDNTVDALLASYRRAISEFRGRRAVPNLAAARRASRRPTRRKAWA